MSISTMRAVDVMKQWHTVLPFTMAGSLQPMLQNELRAEYSLTSLSLRVDLLYIQREKPVGNVHPIAQGFRTHNVIEFKSPKDRLYIKGYYKGVIYARMYQHNCTPEDNSFEDVSLTLVCTKEPKNLFRQLDTLGYEVIRDSPVPGIFQVHGEQFPVQIVVLDLFLDPEIAFPFTPFISPRVRIRLRLMVRLVEERLRNLQDEVWREITDFCFDNGILTEHEIKEVSEMLNAREGNRARLDRYAEILGDSYVGRIIQEKGREEGKAEGREEGIMIGMQEVIRTILQGGMDVGLLAELTGIPADKIRQMQSEM